MSHPNELVTVQLSRRAASRLAQLAQYRAKQLKALTQRRPFTPRLGHQDANVLWAQTLEKAAAALVEAAKS